MPYECTLSKELQEQAKRELNEDPARREEDIEHIRQWIKKQPHLNIRTDDYFILRFLRGCKFSLERTKEKIDMHYTLKAMIPEWFQGRTADDPKLREILKLGFMLPLPERDDKGRWVFLLRQGVCHPKDYHVDDVTRALYLISDVFYEVDETHQVTGAVAICDLEGVTVSHFLQYSPQVMKKSMVLWQDGYVARTKGMYYINFPSSLEMIFNTFKVFMNEKMQKRIKVHGTNYESLYEDVPKRILPKEYGGEVPLNDIIDYWLKILDSKRDWIIEDQKNRVIESKRPGKPKKTEDIFGIDGSFRKLNVD